MQPPFSSPEFKDSNIEKLTSCLRQERQTPPFQTASCDNVSNHLKSLGTRFTPLCYKEQSSAEAYGLCCILFLPVTYIITVHKFFILRIYFSRFFHEQSPVRRRPVFQHLRHLPKKKSKSTATLFYMLSSDTKLRHTCRQLYILLLYAFFWVIPRRLNFICRRFGTLFHLRRQIGTSYLPFYEDGTENTSYLPAYEDGTDRAFRNVGI